MKKVLAWLLLITLCLGLFAGCKKDQGNATTETTAPVSNLVSTEDLESAMEYIRTIYRNAPEKTPKDFQRIGNVPIEGVAFEVVWSVNVSEDVIKIVKNETGMVTIDVNETVEEDTPYVLTATITDGNGNTVSFSWNHLLPAAMDVADILEEAYALKSGESLPYEVTLTGKIVSIDTAYNPDYQNVTVTIQVEGHADKPVQCYRLKGENADKLAVGNIITVTGTLKNYNGTVEFDTGCILDAYEKGDAVEAPTDMVQIVKDAYKLADGSSLPYSCTLKGKVIKVDTPYDPAYKNISVTIAVEGVEDKPILCYRLKGSEAAQIAVNDTITVTGLIKNYRGTIEFDNGCQMIARVSGGGVAQAPSSDPNKILSDAAKLKDGEALGYKATLTGEVVSVDSAYSEQYGNVTVTIKVNGMKIQCYRMKGEHAADVRATDKITVSGFIKNYHGKLEFDTGCTLDAWTMGSRVVTINYGPLKENTAYNMAMAQNAIGKNLYFNGKASGNYLATSENIADAVDIYMDKTEGKGVRFFFMDGETKTYINIIPRDTDPSKTYPNLSTTATGYFTYDEEGKVYAVENSGSKFYLGTYGTYNTISTSSTYYITGGNAATVGVSQFVAKFVEAGTELPDQPDQPDQPGNEDEDGTELTIPEAITLGEAQASGMYTTVKYKVTGKITEIYNTQYGNMYIGDDAGKTLLIYGTYSADGSTRFDAMTNQPKVGDTVTIYGAVGNFNGTAQIKNGWIVAINGENQGETPDTPDTPADPTTPVKPEVGTAYHFGMIQEAVSTTDIYYLAGGMSGFYMASTNNAADALEVYLEPATNGYYLYYMDGSNKTYINMVVSADGAHVNGEYSATKSTVYTYDEEMQTLVTDINNGTYRFGTRNDKTYTTIGPVDVNKGNFYCKFYAVGGSEGGETPDTPDTPDTPADNKLTIQEAIAMGAAKEHNTYTTEKYQVTGVITEVYNTQYGNMKVTDGNGNILTIYGTYSADGSDRYDAMSVKPVAGDTVTILGVVGQYNDVAQIKNGWIIEHIPAEGGETPDTPDTPDTPVVPEQPTGNGYAKVTAAAQFTSGKYVLVAGNGYAPKALDDASKASPWLLSGQPTVSGDSITSANAAGYVFTVTVDGTSATLTDASGNALSPKAGNTNGIIAGDYDWAWSFADGTFQFAGVGEDTTMLACNSDAINGLNRFRAYKTTTVAGSTGSSYFTNFTLYKLVEEGSETPDTPDAPETPDTPDTPDTPVEPVVGYVTEVTTGTAYKWGINQEGLGKVIYFAGDMDGYYGKTTESFDEAVDVTLEAATGGYYVSFVDATGAKKYVNVVINGTHKNFTIADSASTVYTFDEEYDTLNTELSDGETYYIGTYGTYKTFSVSAISKITTSYPSHFYVEGAEGGEGGETPDTPDTPDTPVVPEQPTGTGYLKLTAAAQFTSGKYVLVAGNGYAPNALDDASKASPWLLSGQPTVSGDSITSANAAGYVFTVTVDGTSATLTDASGNALSPKAGNTNGIIAGDYDWAWSFANGTFQFAGVGEDTTMLACNSDAINGLNRFRAYKTTTVTGSTGSSYFTNFTLYKLVEE